MVLSLLSYGVGIGNCLKLNSATSGQQLRHILLLFCVAAMPVLEGIQQIRSACLRSRTGFLPASLYGKMRQTAIGGWKHLARNIGC